MGATSHDLHIDQLLTNMAIGYRPEGFIADMIFPTVQVGKQSDLYSIFSRADALRRQDTKRAPGTRAKQIHRDVSSDSYFANNYALSMALVLEDKANMDPIFVSQLANKRAQYILDHLLLDWEVRVASQVTSTSNVGSSSSVGSAWNGAGDPLGDVNQAIDNVYDSTGKAPNRVTFGLPAWRAFRRDATVRNLIFGVDNGGMYPSRQQVADLLEVEHVLVGGGFRNTGEEGVAESLTNIWNDNCLVSYAPNNPDVEVPSFGYNFRWSAPGLPEMVVERHPYDSRTKSEDIEAGYYQDEKITGSDYAFLITGVNSSQ